MPNRILRIPEDKNGGYDLPLSREMLRTLARARRYSRQMNPAASRTYIWVSMPGKKRRGSEPTPGHLRAPVPSSRDALPYYNHDLRHTWAGVADDVELAPADKEQLGNWKAKTMAGRYTNRSKRETARLVALQEMMTAEVLTRCGVSRSRLKRDFTNVVPFAIST